jgi:hypothetical protein
MGKKLKSGSGMNIPDHNSKSLETIFKVFLTYLKFFDAEYGSETRNLKKIKIKHLKKNNLFDPGYGVGKIRIRDPR